MATLVARGRRGLDKEHDELLRSQRPLCIYMQDWIADFRTQDDGALILIAVGFPFFDNNGK